MEALETYFSNLALADWKDVSIIAQGILTCLLVGIGAYQLLHLCAAVAEKWDAMPDAIHIPERALKILLQENS